MFLASASHLALQRDSSPKMSIISSFTEHHVILSKDEHKQIFFVHIRQGEITISETTQSEHDSQV